tara:strand:+ start:1295 stop:2101 length:807 start_codon:yes stop_codon:yes gene_type:complete
MSSATIITDARDVLHFNVINHRVINVVASTKVEEKHSDNGNISELEFTNGIKIVPGVELNIKGDFYKVNSILKSKPEQGVQGYLLYTSILNKTSTFILPMLGYNKSIFKWDTSLMNCFVEVDGQPETDDELHLWYRYIPSVEMESFEDFLTKHPMYLDMKDLDKHHALYRFSIPEEYVPDYKLIKKGRYSKITDLSKKRILDFHSSSIDKPLGKILYKAEDRKKSLEKQFDVEIDKDAELHDPFYQKDETFYDSYILTGTSLSPNLDF